MLRNTAETYGCVTKFFHWTLAVLIIGMLALGYYMSTPTLYSIHKMIGLLVLVLVILRILWTLTNRRPKLHINFFEKLLSRSVQALLYLCMLLMPLSGWAMATAFGFAPHIGKWMIPMPGMPIDHSLGALFLGIHTTTAIILIVLIVLHVLGALKHHFLNRDNVLKRMLP